SRSFDGVIRSWNPGAERLFGYSAAEAVGKPISLIVPTKLLQEEEEVISRLQAGERVEHFESVRLRRGGEELEVSLTISLVKNDAGQVFGASKIVRDITRQKRARRRLETQDAVTRALAESSTLDAAA